MEILVFLAALMLPILIIALAISPLMIWYHAKQANKKLDKILRGIYER